MKRYLLLLGLLIASMSMAAGELTFNGTSHDVITIEPAANTGLNAIYVLYDTQGVSMTYNATTASYVNWMIYGEGGGGYAQDITSGITRNGRTSTLNQVTPDHGYIIEEGTNRTYVWVTDYSKHRLRINSLLPIADGDCGTASIEVDGQCDDIVFYSITGVRRVLDRQLKLTYNTLEWNSGTEQQEQGEDPDQEQQGDGDEQGDNPDEGSDTHTSADPIEAKWEEKTVEESLEGFKDIIAVPAPLENTTFTLSGDRFLETWHEAISKESDTYTTAAIDVRTTAIQEERHNDNEKKSGDGTTLGDSAPATITFKAYPTDAVVFREWQMSRDIEFNNIEIRINQDETTQTFNQEGTYYWRYVAANDEGVCQMESDTYTVSIGVSELYCPNVFSPGSTPGVNDEWKVSYRSIIEFECWIFNRWGNQIAHFTDPSQGWDGTYKGKLVNSGVYYYVIQARGSDGKRYKLGGDINIIRHKSNPHSTTPSEEGGDGGGGDGGGEQSGDNVTE